MDQKMDQMMDQLKVPKAAGKAVVLTYERFRAIHPVEGLPKWFSDCVRVDIEATNESRATGKRFVIMLVASPRLTLEENYYFEYKDDGERMIVHIDPQTGRKSYSVLYEDSGPPIVIFKTVVDLTSEAVEVVVDTDISTMDESLYEPYPQSSLSADPLWLGR